MVPGRQEKNQEAEGGWVWEYLCEGFFVCFIPNFRFYIKMYLFKVVYS